MKMPFLEFEVWCSCGNGLCGQTKDIKGGISVEPCEKCLDKARGEGRDEGYNEGRNENEGHRDGN